MEIVSSPSVASQGGAPGLGRWRAWLRQVARSMGQREPEGLTAGVTVPCSRSIWTARDSPHSTVSQAEVMEVGQYRFQSFRPARFMELRVAVHMERVTCSRSTRMARNSPHSTVLQGEAMEAAREGTC